MSFLSPPLVHKGPRVPTPGSAASVKTPYKKNIHPLPFLSPLTGYQKGDEFDLATQQAFEEFLFNAYFLEFEARKKAHDQHKEQTDQDDILSVVDSDVKARLKHYSRDELLQIKKFYKEFTALIAAMMNHLHSFTEDMPDDLVNAAVENLKPLKSEQFVQNDLEAYLMTAAANLERFNVQFKAILTKVDWYNSKEAWCFYMALLAFAIGLSLHFMPVVGATIAIPLATQWLALLTNILVPASVLGVAGGISAHIAFSCFAKSCSKKVAEPNLDHEQHLKTGVKRLLVQVARELLVREGLAEAEPDKLENRTEATGDIPPQPIFSPEMVSTQP